MKKKLNLLKKLFAVVSIFLYTNSYASSDFVNGKQHDSFEVIEVGSVIQPSVSPRNHSRIYYNATNQTLMISNNGTAYIPIGTGTGSGNGNVTWVTAPANPTSNGTVGQIAVSGDYLYWVKSTDNWLRVLGSVWVVVRRDLIFNGRNLVFNGRTLQR